MPKNIVKNKEELSTKTVQAPGTKWACKYDQHAEEQRSPHGHCRKSREQSHFKEMIMEKMLRR